jgi:RNA polymerase sigma-70 factor (ECF subfamily)
MDFSEFQEYYEQFKNKIYSYLYYRCGRNKALAEDLTADVFLKALEKRHTFQKEQGGFQAWIYAIAHHHLIDYFRKTRTTVNLDDLENVIEADTDPKSSLMRRVAAEEVEELLKEVSDEEKEILLMRYHQGLPLAEIADIVDRPEPTVRVIIHRALGKLRSKYAAVHPE